MGTAIAIAGGAQLAYGIYQSQQAKNKIENYERQELVNTAEGLTPSTYKAQFMIQEANKGLSTTAEALQSAGARGLQLLPQAVGQYQQGIERAGIDLDMQGNQIELYKAQQGERIQQMQERREEMELGGYAQQYATGQQDIASGLSTGLAAGVMQYGGGGSNTNNNNGGWGDVFNAYANTPIQSFKM